MHNLFRYDLYKVLVTAKKPTGASTSLNASNSLYSFLVNIGPSAGSVSTQYVIENGSDSINVLNSASCGIPGCTLAIQSTNAGSLGTTSVVGSAITYSASANATGVDSFSYVISDGRGGTATGTVAINLMSPTTWTGNAGTNVWTNAANWCGSVNNTNSGCLGTGSVPSSSDIAIFDATCSSNCSAHMNSSVSVQGLQLNSGYSGTVTQVSGSTLAVGSSGFTLQSGSFVGSSTGDRISINGPVTLNGGNMTATSGTLVAGGNWIVSGTPTFIHNSGTIEFAPGGDSGSGPPYEGGSPTITPGNLVYNSILIYGCRDSFTFSGTMTVDGNLSLEEASSNSTASAMYGGVIDLKGDLHSIAGGMGGTTSITLVGNAAGQTISGNSYGAIPSLVIDTGSNNVTLSGTVVLVADFTVTSVGTLVTTGSTLQFTPGGFYLGLAVYEPISPTYTLGTVTYNNVTFYSDHVSYNLNGGTLNVGGNLVLNDDYTSYINNGTIDVQGNITALGHGDNGTATIVLTGNPAGQTITGVSGANFPSLTLATGSNNVTMSGTLQLIGAYTVTSVGTLNASSADLYFYTPYEGTVTYTPGSATYGNVFFETGQSTVTLVGTFNVGGNLTFNESNGYSSINSGTFSVAGNVTFSNLNEGGTANITLAGSSAQTVSVCSGCSTMNGAITVNNSSGITLASNVNWNSTGQTLSVVSGSVSMNGYSLNVSGLSLNGNTVHEGGGTLTVAGSVYGAGSYFGGTIANP